MSKLLLSALAIALTACAAAANSFTAAGEVREPGLGHEWRLDEGRYDPASILLEDGSFEDGSCLEGDSGWVCSTSNDCDWIADLVPLGLWNYDGDHVAWLGGFCGGEPTESTSICQTVSFVLHDQLSWYWMAYVNDGGTLVSATLDGETIYSKVLELGDHLQDFQFQSALVPEWVAGEHELCFLYELGEAGGDNYFVDYVERIPQTPVDRLSFSTVKSLY